MPRSKVIKNKSNPSPVNPNLTANENSLQAVDPKLALLWLCLRNKPGSIDHESVGRSLGISNMASKLRFLRLKKQMEKIEFLDENDEQPAGKEGGDEEEELYNVKGKSKLKVVPEDDRDQVMEDEA